MGSVSYLDRYPLLQSRDSEFARDRLFATYGADRFEKHGGEFGIQANFARLHRSASPSAPMKVQRHCPFRILDPPQFFSIQGAAAFRPKDRPADLGLESDRLREARLDLDFAPGYRQLVLRMEAGALERLLKGMLATAATWHLRFTKGEADPAAMTQVRQDVFRFVDDWRNSDRITRPSPSPSSSGR